jgi:hypothetical protein
MLFAAFPLAYQTRCHIEIPGEDCLARALTQTERADFVGFQWSNRGEAQVL